MKRSLLVTLKSSLFLLCSILASASWADEVILVDSDKSVFIDPQTLAIRWQLRDDSYAINGQGASRGVSNLRQVLKTQASWRWPRQDIDVSSKLEDGKLILTFNTKKLGAFDWFVLPNQSASILLLPFNEGMRIPIDNKMWIDYLTNAFSGSNTTWDLKMPFWSIQQKALNSEESAFVNIMLLNPFNNTLKFSDQDGRLAMTASHEITPLNNHESFSFAINLGDDMLSAARWYRRYRQEQGSAVSLKEKMNRQKNIEKLIGASHVYLFGSTLIAMEDVKDWWGLKSWLFERSDLRQFVADKVKQDFSKLVKGEAYLSRYEKQVIVEVLEGALSKMFSKGDVNHPEHIKNQYEAAQKRKQYLMQHAGQYLSDPHTWGQGISSHVVNNLHNAGLKNLWLGLGKWTAAFYHPNAVSLAKQKGYLVAAYDSYNTAIPPGVNDSWISAQIPEKVRLSCAIVKANGKRQLGFSKKGFYLNPNCGRAFVEKRISDILSYGRLNSLFLDADATGMVREDYPSRFENTPASKGVRKDSSQSDMAEAYNSRMSWVVDQKSLVLGSEDGNAVTSQAISYAHGMETTVFGWNDKDMRKNKQSPYYLGKYYPNYKPQVFFKAAKVKEPYKTLLFSPQFQVPLYQTVFHDEIIASHHWESDSLKFSNIQENRDLKSMLYNTPPMVHLSRDEVMNKKGPRIKALLHYQSGFREIHQHLWDKSLVKFEWLTKDGMVQRCTFSDGSTIVANFDSEVRKSGGETLQAYSVLASLKSLQNERFRKLSWQSKRF